MCKREIFAFIFRSTSQITLFKSSPFSSNNEYYIYHTVSLLLVLRSLKDRAAWWQSISAMNVLYLVASLDSSMFTMHMTEAAETMMTERIIKILVFNQRLHFFLSICMFYTVADLASSVWHTTTNATSQICSHFYHSAYFFFFISLREHFSQIKYKILTDSSLDK